MELLIGFEKEFYTNSLLDKAQVEHINKKLSRLEVKLVKERGKLQYEMVCFPQKASLQLLDDDLSELYHSYNVSDTSCKFHNVSSFIETSMNSIITLYHKQLSTLQSELFKIKHSFDDSPKPYVNDYGSALQLSFSIHNFCRDDYYNAIYSILFNCKKFHHKMNVDSGFERFKKQGFMSPTHICWGGNNNRTTLIRALNIDNIDKNEKKNNTRIEYRGANSNVDIMYLIEFIVQMLILSRKKKYPTYPKIWGNAYDKQYNLEKL